MKPVVDGLRRAYEGRIDFMVYADLDSRPDASDYARKQGVDGVPTSMLVAADGTELQRWVGSVSEVGLRAAFDAALGSTAAP